MKYIKVLSIALFMLLLCSCSSAGDFSPPDYAIIEKPNNNDIVTVDGYRNPAAQNNSEPAVSIYYANKNSKKFHIPECIYAQKMNDSSVLLEKDRDVLIANGYTPCSKCKP